MYLDFASDIKLYDLDACMWWIFKHFCIIIGVWETSSRHQGGCYEDQPEKEFDTRLFQKFTMDNVSSFKEVIQIKFSSQRLFVLNCWTDITKQIRPFGLDPQYKVGRDQTCKHLNKISQIYMLSIQ